MSKAYKSRSKEVQSLDLLLRKRYVKNLLSLRDENEKALTYTLGYIIAKSPNFRKMLFRKVLEKQIKGNDISIEIEQTEKELTSRYDILIRANGKPRLIIEGKIYSTKPKPDQCIKYVNCFIENPTNGNQRLLLVYDLISKESQEKQTAKIKEELKKNFNRRHKAWRAKPSHYVRDTTWDDIWGWCETILKKKSDTFIEGEKELLINYKNYLELDRYEYASINDLDLREKRQLKNAINEIDNISRHCPAYIEKIPAQNRTKSTSHLYCVGENKKGQYKEGFVGYKHGVRHVFGTLFRWKNNILKELYIYFILPTNINKLGFKMNRVVSQLNQQRLLKINKEYGRYEISMMKEEKIDLSQIELLNRNGFFNKAVNYSKKY